MNTLRNATLNARLTAAVMAIVMTTLTLGGIDGLALQPMADSVLAQLGAEAVGSGA